jgi:cyclase
MIFKSHALRLLVGAISGGLLLGATPMLGQAARTVTKLADGVYEIEHRGEPFPSGNTTVIIGDRQVFVVDSCFLPAAAREDIAQIRQWTDKPVSFVLNTHFHNDHNLGNRVYMDAFPAVTIIAEVETKKDMDMFGPGSESREEKSIASFQRALDTGKTKKGRVLTAEEIKEVKDALAQRLPVVEELKKMTFQSATLTFDHDFSIDVGNREVQVKFLGRGNTNGDAVVYLPREKIVVAGDLVVYPLPYAYDGYPTEWIQTLQKLAALDASTIVPGHGPVLHDKAYVLLIGDLLKSAVEQMSVEIKRTGPAMFRTLDEVKGAVDLSAFRPRFANKDVGDTEQEVNAAFDDMTAHVIKIVFEEAAMR